jgi:Tfp pilus assembly protein PilX
MTQRALQRLRGEEGVAMILAVVLMALMLALGLGAVTFVDNQNKLTGNQRQRETSFNIAEAALNAQVTQISDHWVTTGNTPWQCPGSTYCPNGAELTALVPSADVAAGVTWRSNVYDNSGGLAAFFADSKIAGQCGCDANGDNKVWVRAEATVHNRTRVIVSLVQKQLQAESVPHAAMIAGALTIPNNGNHQLIQTNGGVLAVRCTVPASGDADPSAPCLGQPLGKAPTQTPADWNDKLTQQIVGFATNQQGYSAAPVFSQDQINRFINTAQANGTYYTGCPSSLTGSVVVVNTTGECKYTGNDQWNTKQAPGFLLFLNAASDLYIGGNTTYYGVVYHGNMGSPPTLDSSPQSTSTLVTLKGNTQLVGGVIIEGPGRLETGDSGQQNLFFDDHGYDAVQSFAAAGIIQNSWREIAPGQ